MKVETCPICKGEGINAVPVPNTLDIAGKVIELPSGTAITYHECKECDGRGWR